MKIVFDLKERRVVANQLYQLAIEASQGADKKLYKALMKIVNQFTDQSTISHIKWTEAQLIIDMTSTTIDNFQNRILPQLVKVDKPEKEKQEKIDQANELIKIATQVVQKLKQRMDEINATAGK